MVQRMGLLPLHPLKPPGAQFHLLSELLVWWGWGWGCVCLLPFNRLLEDSLAGTSDIMKTLHLSVLFLCASDFSLFR